LCPQLSSKLSTETFEQISDNPTSKDLARQAVALIAEARKSDTLRYFLQTGELGAAEMDVGEAFRLLQILDRTVDDAAILAAYLVCCTEAPAQIESYRRALGIIAQEKGSAMISNTLAHDAAQSSRNPVDWPVGLRNIGNTCYLNSLLQFYFTVKPFRSMVLNFDEFRMPLDDESMGKKQVGSRKVSVAEIKRSQRCGYAAHLLTPRC
jgi:ubiquitin carboxyl-terminal hydrolase 25/28